MARNRKPLFETLESRKLLYALPALEGGILTIQADRDGGIVEVSQNAGRLVVTSYEGARSRVDSFDGSKVGQLVFQGSQNADDFSNKTALRATVYGKSGDDVLRGGPGSDLIFGGSGDDIIFSGEGPDIVFGDAGCDSVWGQGGSDLLFGGEGDDVLFGGGSDDWLAGEAGNDTLLGCEGNDVLYGGFSAEMATNLHNQTVDMLLRTATSLILGGLRDVPDGDDMLDGGSDNDWLFGGTGHNYVNGSGGDDGLLSLRADNEHLYGGAGNDRFLLHKNTSASLSDLESRDVKIRFKDSSGDAEGFGPSQWSASDVHEVDRVFADLARVARTTRILEKADGGTVAFVRRGNVTDVKAAGDTAAWNSGGTITLPNRALDSPYSVLTLYVAHELGHNWDDENRDWRGFMALSGWTDDNPNSPQYVKGLDDDEDWWYLRAAYANFNSTYARTDPYEDFAEAFAAYFTDRLGYSYHGIDAAAAPEKTMFIEIFVTALRPMPTLGRLVIA